MRFDQGPHTVKWAAVPASAKNLLVDLTHPDPVGNPHPPNATLHPSPSHPRCDCDSIQVLRPNCDEILRCDWFREAHHCDQALARVTAPQEEKEIRQTLNRQMSTLASQPPPEGYGETAKPQERVRHGDIEASFSFSDLPFTGRALRKLDEHNRVHWQLMAHLQLEPNADTGATKVPGPLMGASLNLCLRAFLPCFRYRF